MGETYGQTASLWSASVLSWCCRLRSGHLCWPLPLVGGCILICRFATYNTLDSLIPVPDEMLPKLGRNALLGFCSSVVSDTVSNSLRYALATLIPRVLKTVRQTSEVKISYVDAAQQVIEKDGVIGLFVRNSAHSLGQRVANAHPGERCSRHYVLCGLEVFG